MTNLLELYDLAEHDNVDVDWVNLDTSDSLSIRCCGRCAIALNPWKLDTINKETTILAHELGHCETGAFYNRWATCDIRQKHENRANRWAIMKMIPKEELDEQVMHGNTEAWSLAEHFGVTEDFMREAMWFYLNGNLAVNCG